MKMKLEVNVWKENRREREVCNQAIRAHKSILLKILDGKVVCLNFFKRRAICKISHFFFTRDITKLYTNFRGYFFLLP
jgi:hypothetical protein